jgi:hypothetical protein
MHITQRCGPNRMWQHGVTNTPEYNSLQPLQTAPNSLAFQMEQENAKKKKQVPK